jgi:hypothetical protein
MSAADYARMIIDGHGCGRKYPQLLLNTIPVFAG